MAQVKPKLVLLFRASKESEEDKFAKELKNSGYESVTIPVLAFKFVNVETLTSHLENITNFSAVIFTSPRAVEAVEKASEGLGGDQKKKFSAITCYVVGKATGAAAAKIGFTPTGEDSGIASELAKVIVDGPPQEGKPFLYPCANIRRDVLANAMKEKELAYEEITAYESCPNEGLESALEEMLKKEGVPEFAVFFSPSGVQHAQPLVKKGVLPIDKIKVVALGASTKMEIESRNFPLYGVTPKPDPSSLVTLLKEGPPKSDD